MSPHLVSSAYLWGIGVAASVLAALLLILEWKRGRDRAPAHRWLRLFATVGVVAALVWLAIRPLRWIPTDPRAAVLVTSPGSDSLVEAASGGSPESLRFALPRAGDLASTVSLPDTAFLGRHFPELTRIEVVGDGLDPWELASLEVPLSFRPSRPPEPGLERLSWPRERVLGEPLQVQGVWRVPEEALRFELIGPGGVEDTQEIELGASAQKSEDLPTLPFSVSTQPRTHGRLLYRLRLVTAGKPQEVPIEVVVREPTGPRLLWLESAPRFETRHFKNWFASFGGALAIRSTISRDRFRRETFGEASSKAGAAPSQLSADSLRAYDLVVLDREIASSLSAGEVEALRTEVVEQGLGLLLLPYGDDTTNRRSLRRLGLEVGSRPVGDLEQWAARVAWPGSGEALESASPLLIPAREWILESGWEATVSDVNGRVIAARRPLGLGRVGVTVLADSFRWVLEGAAAHHERYWSRLLSALARPLSAEGWRIPAGPVLLDRPLDVSLWSAQDGPSASVVTPAGETLPLALAQDLDEPHRWHARLWPRGTGWHQLRTENAATPAAWFHAHSPVPWQSWIGAQRRHATRERAISDLERETSPPSAPMNRVARELPRWPAYCLLLLCIAYLWTDERLRG